MLDSNDPHYPFRSLAARVFKETTGKDELTTLSEFADFLDAMDNSETALIGFDMGISSPAEADEVNHPCGTACCIGGWVRLLTGSTAPINEVMMDTFNMGYGDADDICYPSFEDVEAYSATPKQAAHVLRHYVVTSKVDWSLIGEIE